MIKVLDEIVRNKHIVLWWRINGIASRMTLKSSEVKNFLSWRINTVLKPSSRGRSSWFCFSLWSACKSKHFRLRFRGFLFVVAVLFVDQVCDQLVSSMRNSDPRVRIVCSQIQFLFPLHIYLAVTGCDFQHGSNSGVPSNPTFRVRWFFISWQCALTTSHWICKLWELVSVFCHEVLSDFHCFQESCISTHHYQSILLWKPFHSFFNPFFRARLMSTQYTVFWCFFHALCMYYAWRGAFMSIVSRSLWFLSMGSTGRKKTVCLLLKICPPGINPELMMKCKLIAHPTW